MISTTILSSKKLESGEYILERIFNKGNERIVLKKEGIILWFFTSRYEKEDGNYQNEIPPYGIDSENYDQAIQNIINLLRVT